MTDRSRARWVLLAMCTATFMAILDTTVVNLGLHRIRADLGAGVAELQWVLDLYNVAYAGLVLTGGVLGDALGRRRVFLAGVGAFALGTVLCAAAPGAGVLIAGRGIAGVGAALLLPTSLSILHGTFEGPARARAVAVWASANGLAMAVGPAVGGVLLSAFGWRAIFWLVLPFAAACALLAAITVPEQRDQARPRLDALGQALAAAALLGISSGLIEGPRSGLLGGGALVVAGLALGAAFLRHEARTAAPMMPLTLFRSRPFSAAVAGAVLMTFGFYAFLFAFPLYLQARGATPIAAGLALLPLSVAFLAVSSLATGPLQARLGAWPLVAAGMLLAAAGLTWCAAQARVTPGTFGPALAVAGVGMGLFTGPISHEGVARVPPDRAGVGSGLVNTARLVGATMSVALMGIFFGGRAAGPAAIAGATRSALLMAAAAEGLGAVVAVTWMRPRLSAAAGSPPARRAGAPRPPRGRDARLATARPVPARGPADRPPA